MMIEFTAREDSFPHRILSMKTERQAEIGELFREMCYQWTFHRETCRNACMSSLYSLLTMLENEQNTGDALDGKRELIAPSIRCIEENCCRENLSVGYLASLAGVSEVYFRRIFHVIYGISPSDFIRQVRIDRAKSLLAGDYGSIAEISETVGYTNIFYFSRVFRQSTGMSPTEYARTLRAEKNK